MCRGAAYGDTYSTQPYFPLQVCKCGPQHLQLCSELRAPPVAMMAFVHPLPAHSCYPAIFDLPQFLQMTHFSEPAARLFAKGVTKFSFTALIGRARYQCPKPAYLCTGPSAPKRPSIQPRRILDPTSGVGTLGIRSKFLHRGPPTHFHFLSWPHPCFRSFR